MMATTGFLQQLITNPERLNNVVDEAKELAFQYGVIIRTHEAPNSSEVGTTTQICLNCFYVFNQF